MTENEYIKNLYVREDDVLNKVKESMAANDMPMIALPPDSAKLLYLLARISRAKNILEIGTLAGYSTIWLARSLPEDGSLLTLELEEDYARVAKQNFIMAGVEGNVSIRVGEALDSLSSLRDSGETFDFFFIDADKVHYPEYLEMVIEMAKPGALITADNTFWGGRVLDPANREEATEKIRLFNQMLSASERLEAMIIPTGDGLAVAKVNDL